jgi:SAM-dependent methyltransferase
LAVTANDVVWCYRKLLEREPESQDTVRQLMLATADIKALVSKFIASDEYQHNIAKRGLVPLDCQGMAVDVEASSADLARLKDRIRATWTELGLNRPHHSVLTGDSFLPQLINDQSVEEFYASGVAESRVIHAILNRHGFTAAQAICMEYGCGLGRVTLALAKTCKMVRGHDISATHLELAKQRAAASGVRNVEFILSSKDAVIDNLPECDFFYSRIVFQHNPPPLMRVLISACLTSLRAGGMGIFQVPTYAPGYQFRVSEYLASPRSTEIEMHCLPQDEIFALIAEAGCKLLEVREDASIGHLGHWISNTFVVRR